MNYKFKCGGQESRVIELFEETEDGDQFFTTFSVGEVFRILLFLRLEDLKRESYAEELGRKLVNAACDQFGGHPEDYSIEGALHMLLSSAEVQS